MRLIADGVIDREGVPGLSLRLGYSERHLNRLVTDELGAGPLAIARAQRAQTARVLIETTAMPMTDVAFAAGFASIRQFNDTVREVFDTSPSGLRAARRAGTAVGAPGTVQLRLPVRGPFAAAAMLGFIGSRAVDGVEAWDGITYTRTLRLPRGPAIVTLSAGISATGGTSGATGDATYVQCGLRLGAMSDLQTAVQRCRRLLDLDADPIAVDAHLAADPVLEPLVRKRPGLRSPGCVDGAELLVRAILGQQVSVAGARTIAGRLTAAVGERVDEHAVGAAGVTHLFPSAAVLRDIDPALLPMPAARRRSLVAACAAVADGTIVIDAGADRDRLIAALLRIDGIGPWTAAYVAMRGVGDPDVFMPTDLGVRHSLEALGLPSSPAAADELANRWRPWRSYALHHLWADL